MLNHLSNEAILVDEARAGNTQAFVTLVNHYDEKVFRLAVNITRNREDAEDVLQEALLKAYVNIGRFRGGSRFYTWLVRIALNEALMKLRKRRSGRQVSLDELVETDEQNLVRRETVESREDPEEGYARQELERNLHRAVEHLEHSCRQVLLLRDVENLSTRQTAELLGLSVTTVKTRLRRARTDLRRRLNRQCRADECRVSGASMPERRTNALLNLTGVHRTSPVAISAGVRKQTTQSFGEPAYG